MLFFSLINLCFSNCPIIYSIYRNNDQNINLILSEFSNVLIIGDGGAIYINGNYKMEINNSVFFYCITNNGQGGGIFFNNGLDSIIYKVCVYKCHTNTGNYYQFAFIRTQNNKLNLLSYISMSNCNNETICYTSLRLLYGIQNITNINCSYNNNIYTCIHHYYPNVLKNIFSTYYKNTMKDYICIHLEGNSGLLSKLNIVQNNSPKNYGIIFLTGSSNYYLNESTCQSIRV